MKIIYNNFLPIPGYSAMMLFGVIFARKKFKPLDPTTINHEAIHDAQAKECGGYVRYYLRYFGQWIKYKGYRNIPFEKEAYTYAYLQNYLEIRQAFAWKKYAK